MNLKQSKPDLVREATKLEMANFKKISKQVSELFALKRQKINGKAHITILRRRDNRLARRCRPKLPSAA